MGGAVINDGQTRSARVIGNGEPPLWIEYRPMLVSDRSWLLGRIASLRDEGEAGLLLAEELLLKELSGRVVSWTMLDDSRGLLPIDMEMIRRLAPSRLVSIAILVLGLEEQAVAQEQTREINLVEGVRILLTKPKLALRDCDDCLKYVYDEQTGGPVTHAGRPVARPAGTFPPCRLPHVGCSKGTPERPHTLSPENRQAFHHYIECQSVGRFPDDPIVRRNASLISRVERSVARQRDRFESARSLARVT